jgi:hypothetical protein
MTWTEEKFMSSLPVSIVAMVDINPGTVHEQTLLSFLCFLILFLGVISGVVNKAPFDVSLCHDMFKWTNVV